MSNEVNPSKPVTPPPAPAQAATGTVQGAVQQFNTTIKNWDAAAKLISKASGASVTLPYLNGDGTVKDANFYRKDTGEYSFTVKYPGEPKARGVWAKDPSDLLTKIDDNIDKDVANTPLSEVQEKNGGKPETPASTAIKQQASTTQLASTKQPIATLKGTGKIITDSSQPPAQKTAVTVPANDAASTQGKKTVSPTDSNYVPTQGEVDKMKAAFKKNYPEYDLNLSVTTSNGSTSFSAAVEGKKGSYTGISTGYVGTWNDMNTKSMKSLNSQMAELLNPKPDITPQAPAEAEVVGAGNLKDRANKELTLIGTQLTIPPTVAGSIAGGFAESSAQMGGIPSYKINGKKTDNGITWLKGSPSKSGIGAVANYMAPTATEKWVVGIDVNGNAYVNASPTGDQFVASALTANNGQPLISPENLESFNVALNNIKEIKEKK